MPLTVEDGTIVANAESYVTTAFADTYFTNRGDAAWAGLASATVKEQLLRKATDYMQEAYRGSWKGFRTDARQSLDWPRQSVLIEDSVLNAWVDYHTIPTEVKNACCELAKRAISGDLAPDLERAKLMIRVGEISTQYDHTSPQAIRFRAVDMILRPYLKNTGATLGLVRS